MEQEGSLLKGSLSVLSVRANAIAMLKQISLCHFKLIIISKISYLRLMTNFSYFAKIIRIPMLYATVATIELCYVKIAHLKSTLTTFKPAMR